MILWDILKTTAYSTKICVFAMNAYDQNIPVFRGTVGDARCDGENEYCCFDYMTAEVEIMCLQNNIIDIRVKANEYDKLVEDCYDRKYVESWKRYDKSTRPYLYSAEISRELNEY